MFFVVNFDNTPRVSTSADLATVGSVHNLIRTDNSKGNLARNLLGFGDSFFVFVLVCRRLENVNVVVLNIRENLQQNVRYCMNATK